METAEEGRARKRAYNKAYGIANAEKLKAYRKAYFAAHREAILVQQKACRAVNAEKIKARNRTYRVTHRETILTGLRTYYLKHRIEQRNCKIKNLYGISQPEFEALFEKQDCRCAACHTDKFNALGPMIDHDHFTGQTRGILCHACNSILGFAKDCPDRLESLIEYLERYSVWWADELPPKLAAMIQRGN